MNLDLLIMTFAEQFYLAFEFMLLGMGVVFSFLTILIFIVKWMGSIIQKIAPLNPAATVQQYQGSSNQLMAHDNTITAVIGAAIHQYQIQHPTR
jgi:oxaloacetate decarboxylase (Na+ extruding) subunit gamma